jgi:hypothetical protein
MRFIGLLHILLCKIPLIGEPIASALSWVFSAFAWLGGVRRTKSIEETKQILIDSGEKMNFPFEFSDTDGDAFVLELPYCPYGFNDSKHQRPCDTAMNMDRYMLKRCGASLIITDTIPKGADRCRMVIRQQPD